MSVQKLICFFILISFGIDVNAQTPSFHWIQHMGGATYDAWANSITTDAAGNVYTTGPFEGTVDFDPGPGVCNLYSQGSLDIFISKFDASGNFIWAKQVGGQIVDESYSIVVDQTGDIYVTGYFDDIVDFDPGLGVFILSTPNNDFDIFILKLNSSGNFIWAKKMSGLDFEVAKSMTIDKSGNLYLTGAYWKTVDFDPGPGVFNLTAIGGNADIFVCKLDSAGSFVWAKSMGGKASDFSQSIAIDTASNVYITGILVDTVDFDPGPGVYNLVTSGNSDIFISKLDALGNFAWAGKVGGISRDEGHSITVDAFGNLYVTGFFQNTADFDPGPGILNVSPVGPWDCFVLKLRPSGNLVWVKHVGGIGHDDGISIITDTSGCVYTAGTLTGTIDFDPGAGTFNLTEVGNTDFFVLKLDSTGIFKWVAQIGGNLADIVKSITIDKTGDIYTTGHFQGTADFDPSAGNYNFTSIGYKDVFIHKMGKFPFAVFENNFSSDFIVYPNPNNGIFTIDLKENSEVTITNTLGETVLHQTMNKGKQNISLQNRANGIYFVKVKYGGEQKVVKLIKEG